MKHQVVSAVIIGLLIGNISAYTSLFITGQAVTKRNKKNDDVLHDEILNKMKVVLTGTDSESLIEKYTSIMNNTRGIFEYDYSIILKHIDVILTSKKDPRLISSAIETYFTALDIFHDADNPYANCTSTDKYNGVSQKSENLIFFEESVEYK